MTTSHIRPMRDLKKVYHVALRTESGYEAEEEAEILRRVRLTGHEVMDVEAYVGIRKAV